MLKKGTSSNDRINDKDKTGYNLLCLAASNPFSKLSTFEHLLALGCNINHVTDYGYNVLGLYYGCAKKKCPKVIAFLVENGLDARFIDEHTKLFMKRSLYERIKLGKLFKHRL